MLKPALFLAFFLTAYTYLLFPIILFILVKLFGKTDEKDAHGQEGLPTVAILCAMYNEAVVVNQKIENFIGIHYNNLKLYVGSDGSNDGTNAILRRYSNDPKITVFEFERRGKVHVINDLMKEVKEDIVVFTDANSMFEANAIDELIKYFSDPQIGAVCGMLKLEHNGQASGEGFYWRYETAIKKLESALNCVVGANGSIYAVRRELLAPLPADTINDDFTISMRVAEQGYGIKYAENAVAHEEAGLNDAAEFKRHVRDGAGHYRAMGHLYRLLNPLRFKIFFLYVSHRVIRWLVPFFLVLMLALPLFNLGDPLIRKFYYMELVFYLFVLGALATKTKAKLFYVPYYFIYINMALLFGFIRNILGLQKVTWSSTAR